MWECKCPDQLDRTLNRLFPASSLAQSPCNVRMSSCVNRAGQCPENSQQASGRVFLLIMQLVQNRKKTNTRGWRGRVIYTKTPKKMSDWTDNEIRELLSGRDQRQNRPTNSRNGKRLGCLWPNYKWTTWPRCNLRRVLPPARSSKAPPLAWTLHAVRTRGKPIRW